jgi:methionyl-tRNA synthetase
VLAVLAAWELVWKGIALWKAGRNRQLAWFVVILILNTAGILEIIYILFFQRKPAQKNA